MHGSWTLRSTLRRGLLPASMLGLFLAGCGSLGEADWTAGPDAGVGAGPTEPAPTGQRWEAVEDDKGCGRTGIKYVLVDEICGGDGRGYASPQLQAPMFRDGALFGQTLLAVDATHLWALDMTIPTHVKRTQLLSGLGQPVAAAAYGTELLLAAGEGGLVRLDASDPMRPTRTSVVSLTGFALDVETSGARAYVAMGRAGLAVVDLTTGAPEFEVAIPGYATGVTTLGNHAYVASCNALTVVDLTTRSVVGQTWTPLAMDGPILSAAAKDVSVVGDVAFVAAGRHGAVSVDISDPEHPQVLGNCTLPDPSFYASGVRAKDGTLFVAGGEYGILPLDVTDPRAACPILTPVSAAPTPPTQETTDADVTCSTEPPWNVLPWENLWEPPPPAKDPIQTLPGLDVVYAFGDARRIGTRAIDVRSTASSLPILGRYDEPRRALGIAASGAYVLVVGSRGGLFTSDGASLTRTPNDADAAFRDGTAAVFTGAGRWVVLAGNRLFVQGTQAPLTLTSTRPESLAAVGLNAVAVASKDGIEIFDFAKNTRVSHVLSQTSVLPLSIAASDSDVFAAAPEWTQTSDIRLATGNDSPLPTHGVFDASDALDTTLWRTRLPRRQLVTTPRGLVEVAVIGRQAGLVLHANTGSDRNLALPPATYSAASADTKNVYLTSIDRSFYRSTLSTISFTGGAPALVASEVFTGAAAGVASVPGRTYVADADGSVRVYATGASVPVLQSVISLEDQP